MRKLKHDYNITEIVRLQNELDPPRSLAEVGRILGIPNRSLEKFVQKNYRRHIIYTERINHDSTK